MVYLNYGTWPSGLGRSHGVRETSRVRIPPSRMRLVELKCANCKQLVYRTAGRINEARKFGWLTYCSYKCQAKKHDKRSLVKCSNPKCHKNFLRALREIKRFKNSYCSHSCAATVINRKYPKRKKVFIKNKCGYCKNYFYKKGKYCSVSCKNRGQIIGKEEILKEITYFYKTNGRVPFKRELRYNAARNKFGSWNNAIQAAGLTPNPVMFAEKHIAKDGHRCDSLTEKIIDDWFTDNDISHKRSIVYPENSKFTCDFLVGKYFIEFFGLENEHKRYTEVVRKKRKLARKYRIDLIEIKPADIFPKNKLGDVLRFLPK